MSLYISLLAIVLILTITVSLKLSFFQSESNTIDVKSAIKDFNVKQEALMGPLKHVVLPVILFLAANLAGYVILLLMALRSVSELHIGYFQMLRLSTVSASRQLGIRLFLCLLSGALYFGALYFLLWYHVQRLTIEIEGVSGGILMLFWYIYLVFFIPLTVFSMNASSLLFAYSGKGGKGIVTLIVSTGFFTLYVKLLPMLYDLSTAQVFSPYILDNLSISGFNILNRPIILGFEPVLLALLVAALTFYLTTRVWREVEI